MRSASHLLAAGNSKLGVSIFSWSVPVMKTCPGMSEICSAVCYAKRGRYARGYVQNRLDWCFEQSKRADFCDRMCDEIFRRGILVVRVHCAGDFMSPSYTRKWIEISARCPTVRFFGYSRSWSIDSIRPPLFALGALPNFRLWLSADSATGLPRDVPVGVRVAWLQNLESQPPECDLVFRVQKLRKKPTDGAPVCAHENRRRETPRGELL